MLHGGIELFEQKDYNNAIRYYESSIEVTGNNTKIFLT